MPPRPAALRLASAPFAIALTLLMPAVSHARAAAPLVPEPVQIPRAASAPWIAAPTGLEREATRLAAAAAEGSWAQFPEVSAGPAGPRASTHAAIYDPVRDRVIVFGGIGLGLSNLTHAFDVATRTWTPLAVSGPLPAPRRLHGAVYDSVRDRMIVFGGFDGTFFSDLWALDLATATWAPLGTVGPVPAARADFAMVYDAAADRLVLFGGYDGVTPPALRRGDLWMLPLAGALQWQPVTTTTTPSARSGHRAAIDAAGQRLVMFGGYDTAMINDVWSLSLTGIPDWTPILVAGPAPAPRADHFVVWDAAHARLVTFGGYDGVNSFGDAWTLSLSGTPAWTIVAGDDALSPRWGHSGVLTTSGRIVVHGGTVGSSFSNETRDLDVSGVAPEWVVPGLGPGGRFGHSLVHDPLRQRMLLFGGNHSSSDVWAFDLAPIPAWHQLATTGTPPAPRRLHAAVWDATGDRMIVFGGFDGTHHRSDLWGLDFSSTPPVWQQIAYSGPGPGVRSDLGGILDPVGNRLVVFGGYDGATAPDLRRGDVWAYPLAGGPTAWQLLHAGGAGAPSPRSGHRAIYDAPRHRLVTFGGFTSGYRNDVWALALGGVPTWSELLPAGTVPSPRIEYGFTVDPGRDRALLYAGNDAFGYFGDVHALALGSPAWTDITPGPPRPDARSEPGIAFDSQRDRLVLQGGFAGGSYSDTWFLQYDQPTATTLTAVQVDGAGGVARLAWLASGDVTPEVQVQRREVPSLAWEPRGTIVADGAGRFAFEDHEVEVGVTYAYRLAWSTAEGMATGGDVEVTIATGRSLEVRVLAGDGVRVRCTLPAARVATVELFDVRGRRLEAVALPAHAGEATVTFGTERALAAGLYLVRLGQDGRFVMARATVLR